MATDKKISSAVIARLPRYYRYLGELLDCNVERISSKELSERMKVTASQIRQDLNNFGGFGQQGYGYNVAYLHEEIGKILGIDSKQDMVIVGGGNIGQALVKYKDFEKRGFCIRAIFDSDKKVAGKKVGDLVIQHVDMLDDFIRDNNIKIVALTVPKEAAKGLAERLVSLNVKGIWNFAPTDLNLPDNIVVENVHLSESLMRLSYRIGKSEE